MHWISSQQRAVIESAIRQLKSKIPSTRTLIRDPEAMSHNLILPSSPEEARNFPLGENARQYMAAWKWKIEQHTLSANSWSHLPNVQVIAWQFFQKWYPTVWQFCLQSLSKRYCHEKLHFLCHYDAQQMYAVDKFVPLSTISRFYQMIPLQSKDCTHCNINSYVKLTA